VTVIKESDDVLYVSGELLPPY